jgi:hypothetical protein
VALSVWTAGPDRFSSAPLRYKSVVTEDPGDPISYLVLAKGTAVYAEGGVAVGRVKHVLAAADQDIFEGIVVHTHHGDRYVDREQIVAIHERAVALTLDAEECRGLPKPGANPAVMKEDPAEGPHSSLHDLQDMAHHAWDRLSGKR